MNKKLQNAVIRQLGYEPGDPELTDTLNDITNHGINGGFSGFIYYTDTIAFFKANRAEIVALVEEFAEELGESVFDMVARFGCLEGRNWDETRRLSKDGRELSAEIARALYGRVGKDDTQVPNALARFAAEEVARHLTDN